MVSPLVKHTIVKKRRKTFPRHYSDRFQRLNYGSWRKPKGIDSCVRRRYKGSMLMPKIGYGTNAAYRHALPSGFYKFRINNVRELELLLMHNRTYAAEISKAVSQRKRKDIIARANQLNIKVTNAQAKLRTEETK